MSAGQDRWPAESIYTLSTIDVVATCVKNIDENEFAHLVAQYERLIHAYIFSLVQNWTAAEEILQDTYLGLFEKIDEWDPDRDTYAWIKAFAHYQTLNYRSRRRRDRHQFGERFIERVAAAQDAESTSSVARMDAMQGCIGRLSDAHRRLVESVYGGGQGIDEVARETQRTVVATYQMLSRIRKMLRECIERNLQILERA